MLRIAVGALAAFAWSFVLAAIVLRMKHWRNAVLFAHGGLPYKDCVFPRPLWFMGTCAGIATVLPVGLFVSSSYEAMALSAVMPPTTLALVPILTIVSQARHDR